MIDCGGKLKGAGLRLIWMCGTSLEDGIESFVWRIDMDLIENVILKRSIWWFDHVWKERMMLIL